MTSTIHFDRTIDDYLINGKSFKAHLSKHENVRADSFIPAVMSQPGAIERLKGEAAPDLRDGHVAIYLCGTCGGYDGSSIGVKVDLVGDTVVWSSIGHHEDYEEGESFLFRKVRGYKFHRDQYADFLEELAMRAV